MGLKFFIVGPADGNNLVVTDKGGLAIRNEKGVTIPVQQNGDILI